MNHTDMKKARIWAESVGDIEGLHPEPRAAVEVIRSLPNIVVDGEEIITIYDKYRDDAITLHEAFRAAVALAIPPLPTLADMTPEEREACQWMQADVKLADGGSATCVIANPRMPGAKVRVWAPHGGSDDVEEGRVTPLPDLPRLEWPAQAPDDVAFATGGALTTQDVVDECRAVRKERATMEPDLPRPEDVPAGEAWLILHNGHEWVGARDSRDGANYPWALARLDGLAVDSAEDSEIDTLISRLVPEVGA